MTSEPSSLPTPYDTMVREVARALCCELPHRRGIILDGSRMPAQDAQYLDVMAAHLAHAMTNGKPAAIIEVSAEVTHADLERIVNERGIVGIFVVRTRPDKDHSTIFDAAGPSTYDAKRLSDIPHYYTVNVGSWRTCFK